MVNQELPNQIAAMIEDQTKHIDEEIKANKIELANEIKAIKINIENEVTKRIDALFDGYKLNHEKQWELERKMEALEKRIERLEIAG